MIKIAEINKKSEELKEKARSALLSAGVDLHIPDSKSNVIRIVFAGQYSAGKSSILKMLTGRTDIAIGADITTQQAHTYNWNGIEVVDTPGIHTQLRPDHDEISYNAIVSADILVFVITNELFDSHMAEHFRKLAIDKDKAGEMILVVNKMDRTAQGNTKEQQDIIREDLKKVLEPYTPEQLNLTFLDAESYLDSVEERDTDPELADELAARSGYVQFVETLNRFVEKKKISSKLTTELYVIDDQLEKAIKELQPKSSDEDIDALEENFMQQRHLLIEERGNMKQQVKDIYTLATSQIRDIANEAANLLVEGCNQNIVEYKLQESMEKTENIIDKCQEDAKKYIEEHLTNMGYKLESIENSEFSKNLKTRLNGKFEELPEGIKTMLIKAGPGLQKIGQDVLNNAYKVGVPGGLKLTNFSGSVIHQMVLNTGHFFGVKFRPWEAVKITKGVAIGGQVACALGIGLTVFMQIKEDMDEEKNRIEMKNNRRIIRSKFNSAADELYDHGKKCIEDILNRQLDPMIATIDDHIQVIRDTRTDRSEMCHRLENIQKECRLLIQEIHSSNIE